jgi:hypothetical protein
LNKSEQFKEKYLSKIVIKSSSSKLKIPDKKYYVMEANFISDKPKENHQNLFSVKSINYGHKDRDYDWFDYRKWTIEEIENNFVLFAG